MGPQMTALLLKFLLEVEVNKSENYVQECGKLFLERSKHKL